MAEPDDKELELPGGTTQKTMVGENYVIEAGTSITLKCGASTIHMNQAGFITISGTVVTIAAAANASMVAPMTEVAGGALLALAGAVIMEKGGIVRIDASSLMHVGGSKVEVIGSGETIVQGAPVKLN